MRQVADTMEQRVDRSVFARRFVVLLVGGFARQLLTGVPGETGSLAALGVVDRRAALSSRRSRRFVPARRAASVDPATALRPGQ